MRSGCGTLNRATAVNLLRDIMSKCASFGFAQQVSLSEDAENHGSVVRAKWIRPECEKDCLNGIMEKYNVEVKEKDGYTIFFSAT